MTCQELIVSEVFMTTVRELVLNCLRDLYFTFFKCKLNTQKITGHSNYWGCYITNRLPLSLREETIAFSTKKKINLIYSINSITFRKESVTLVNQSKVFIYNELTLTMDPIEYFILIFIFSTNTALMFILTLFVTKYLQLFQINNLVLKTV